MLSDQEHLKRYIWFERLFYLPIKLIAAYFIYTCFDYGALFIIAYIIFCLSEQSTRQFINAQEANKALNALSNSISQQKVEPNQHTELYKIKDRLADLELKTAELEIAVSEYQSGDE